MTAGKELAEKDIDIDRLKADLDRQQTRAENQRVEIERLKKERAEKTESDVKNSMNTKIEEKLQTTMGQLVLLQNEKMLIEQELSNANNKAQSMESENISLKDTVEKLLDPKGKKKKKK